MRGCGSLTLGAAAALLAVVLAALCLGAPGIAVGADSACFPTADGAPRFCAQPWVGDYALVAVPPAATPTAPPEPLGAKLALSRPAQAERQLHATAAGPRAPPSPLA
jgi:hypothetical protein